MPSEILYTIVKWCMLSAIFLRDINGARILGIFHIPARSHYHLGSALLVQLANEGHDVTMVSPFEGKFNVKNGSYRQIILHQVVDIMKDYFAANNLFENGKPGFSKILAISELGLKMSELTLSEPTVRDLLHDPDEHYDVVIVEQFMNEAHKAIAHHFNAPLIVLSTLGATSMINKLVANTAPTSYIPEILLGFSANMSLWQRLANTAVSILNRILQEVLFLPKEQTIINKHFKNPPLVQDVMYNVSLILLNSHPSISQAVPLVPNMIDIGGFHVKQPGDHQVLTSDLQEYLDGAPDGVIYFSLGSNVRSANMSLMKRNAFLNVFRQLPQYRILWKWEDDQLGNQPQNVKIAKWLPQQEILAHANVKLFITHGGLLSTIETVHHGVPVLTIPIMGDQYFNSENIVRNGLGLSLIYDHIDEDILLRTINQLLQNPKYRETVKEKSRLFRDRPVSPLKMATYWVNYIIRNGGAPHLRVAALNLTWYQYYLIDVIATIVAVIMFPLWFLCCTCRKLKNTGKVKRD